MNFQAKNAAVPEDRFLSCTRKEASLLISSRAKENALIYTAEGLTLKGKLLKISDQCCERSRITVKGSQVPRRMKGRLAIIRYCRLLLL